MEERIEKCGLCNCNYDYDNPNNTCVPTLQLQNGETIKRVPFGSESDFNINSTIVVNGKYYCDECFVEIGSYHHELCGGEQCPICLNSICFGCFCEWVAFSEYREKAKALWGKK